jgi:phosphoglycerate dehydrogenase-like enzyme
MGFPEAISEVFDADRHRLEQQAEFLPGVFSADCIDAQLDLLAQTEVLFGVWGMPHLRSDQLDRLPRLRAVFYAAGSCQSFGRPLLERGILLTSAWCDNAVPVAEFTLAQILLSCKGYWRNVREYQERSDYSSVFRGRGNYGETVALLGMGAIGRALVDLMRPFHLHLVVYDPFLDPAEARQMGIEKVTLAEAFARGYVVSNHLADNARTVGLINGSLLSQMRPGATFINTGRGSTVNEIEMVAVLQQRPDVTALLDVTNPEPMRLESLLRTLPNVRVSGHIAGSVGGEVRRMADSAIAEFELYARGEPPRHQVTLEMLSTMA